MISKAGSRLSLVYVREAPPGENYPHHMSAEQKMQQARDWVKLDKTIMAAVDEAVPAPGSKRCAL